MIKVFNDCEVIENIDSFFQHSCRWLVQVVHGNNFLKRKWEKFIRSRAVPGSGVSFQEIEVTLCNIPSRQELLEEEEEERREEEGLNGSIITVCFGMILF